MEGDTPSHPYVITQEEFRIKNDVITKYHCADNRLQDTRRLDRQSRAKWLPSLYEQVYDPPLSANPNPQIELYYQMLGLGLAREAHTTWTSLSPLAH